MDKPMMWNQLNATGAKADAQQLVQHWGRVARSAKNALELSDKAGLK